MIEGKQKRIYSVHYDRREIRRNKKVKDKKDTRVLWVSFFIMETRWKTINKSSNTLYNGGIHVKNDAD